MFEKIKDLHQNRPHLLSAMFFVFGFIFDLATLDAIDDAFTLATQVLYLIILLILLTLELTPNSWENYQNVLRKILSYQTEVFHFFLGALLSAYTIFYFKSASLAVSFFFLFFMVSLLILNEFPFVKSRGPFVKVGLLTLCSISFFLCLIPTITGSMGLVVFLASLFLGPLPIFAVLSIAKKKNMKNELTVQLTVPTLTVTLVFLALYLFRLIPPVPLSLKHLGVYHQVQRVEGGYQLSTMRPWWKFWHEGDQLFHARENDRVFIFTRIFAPGKFQGDVVVHWQTQDQSGDWQTTDRIPLSIGGGRREGYRGFTYKSQIRPGHWRVMVETPRQLEIGRIHFEIVKDSSQSTRLFSTQMH